jgi:hypothetical protein
VLGYRTLGMFGSFLAVRPYADADSTAAAVAERHHVSVLHREAVFDQIAKVTGQQTQWVTLGDDSDTRDPHAAYRTAPCPLPQC